MMATVIAITGVQSNPVDSGSSTGVMGRCRRVPVSGVGSGVGGLCCTVSTFGSEVASGVGITTWNGDGGRGVPGGVVRGEGAPKRPDAAGVVSGAGFPERLLADP